MTENEKIELFDKWYDENYDEWAEGEEGIALREELEQAFKGGIAELEKKNADLKEEINKIAFARGNLEEENAELKADNDARKFAMAMSEKVEKQLREEIAELKAEIENDRDLPAIAYMQGAEKQKKKDEEELKKWKDEWQEQVQKATDEGYARTLQTVQLSKSKEIIKKFLLWENDWHDKTESKYELLKQAEQFIKDSEVEK